MAHTPDADDLETAEAGYVHTAGRPNDQRRRRRATIVFGTLIAFLVAALVFAIWWGTRPQAPATSAAPSRSTCTPIPAPKPAQITVNVYNGTDRSGIAAGAATTLKGQGFPVAAVKNDPLGKKITGSAQVRYGPKGAAAAQVVAARVPGATLAADQRTDGTVDLVLGPDYTDVSSPAGTGTPTPSC